MDIRKTEPGEDPVEQSFGDTNTQVVQLFQDKPELKSILFTRDDGTEKLYERL